MYNILLIMYNIQRKFLIKQLFKTSTTQIFLTGSYQILLHVNKLLTENDIMVFHMKSQFEI